MWCLSVVALEAKCVKTVGLCVKLNDCVGVRAYTGLLLRIVDLSEQQLTRCYSAVAKLLV